MGIRGRGRLVRVQAGLELLGQSLRRVQGLSGMSYCKTRRPFDNRVGFRTKQLARHLSNAHLTPNLPSFIFFSSLFPCHLHSFPFLCPPRPAPFTHAQKTPADARPRPSALPVIRLGHDRSDEPAHSSVRLRLRPKCPRPQRHVHTRAQACAPPRCPSP